MRSLDHTGVSQIDIEWYGDVEESFNCVMRWSMYDERLIDLYRWRVKTRRYNRFDINWIFGAMRLFLLLFPSLTRIWHKKVVLRRLLKRERFFIAHLQRKIPLARDDCSVYSYPPGFLGLDHVHVMPRVANPKIRISDGG